MSEKLASEILHELKMSSKRWFIVSMIELLVIAVLTLLLILTPTDEYSIEQESDNASTNVIGGSYYGCETEDYLQEAERQ